MTEHKPSPTTTSDNVHLIVAQDEDVKIEYFVEDWLAIVLFWALAFIVFLQFFTRYVLNNSLAWTEEIARYGLMWVVFIGGAIVTRKNRHIAVELVWNLLPDNALRRGLIFIVDLIKLSFLALLCLFAVQITGRMHYMTMTVIDISMSVVYGGIAVGCFLMFFRQALVVLRDIRQHFQRPPVATKPIAD